MTQVKMDRIRFAQLMNYLGKRGVHLDMDDCADIDSALIFDIPDQKVKASDVDELLKQFSSIDGFIGAIKAYRTLTDEGLKESKEAIERYRPNYTNGLEQFKKRAIEKAAGENYTTEHFTLIKDFLDSI